MTEKDLIGYLTRILEDEVLLVPLPQPLTRETDYADLALDSLDQLQLVMWIEERYNIEMYDDETEGLKTVGDLVDYVLPKVAAVA